MKYFKIIDVGNGRLAQKCIQKGCKYISPIVKESLKERISHGPRVHLKLTHKIKI